ncbi:LPS translocon maturation chaperone LptM [Magnetococcales bacterium HHB-1]
MKQRLTILLISAMALLTTACGYKDDLYLPDPNKEPAQEYKNNSK